MIKLEVTIRSGEFVFEKKELKAALRKAGAEVAADARKLIRQKIGGGRLYRGSGGGRQYRGYKEGQFEASAPGNAPNSITGLLAKSIKVIAWKSGEGVAVRDTAFYALFLEAGAEGGEPGRRNPRRRGKKVGNVGTRVLQPRPFLSAALAADAPSIDKRLKEAMLSGFGWKKR